MDIAVPLRTFLLSLIIISMVCLPVDGMAGIYNYQNTIIGERASGMGGAFTALSEDPSGLYYNPAGIAFIEKGVFSLSASILELKTRSYKGYLYGRDLTEVSMNLFPSTYGAIRNIWGGKGGFSIMVTEDSYYRVTGVMEDVIIDANEFQLTLDNTMRDRTYNVGLSYARIMMRGLSLGGTVYYYYRVANYSLFYLLEEIESDHSYGQSIRMEEVKQGLIFHSGVKYKFRDICELGLNIRSGGDLSSRGSLRSTTFEERGEVTSQETVLGGEVTIPLSATLGIAWTIDREWLFSFDLSAYRGGEGREPVMNFNAGMEKYLTPTIPLRLGFYTNRSAAPSIEEGGDTNQPERVNLVGITLGSGIKGKHTSNSVSLIITGGNGEAPGISDSGTVIPYNLTQGSISLVISGSYWF